MRILIVGINYHPELTGIGKFSGEMATYLASQDIDVRVITAPPYYPQWKIQGGYRGWQYKHEKREGVEVWRCPTWVPRKPIGITRLVHLSSFTFSSIPAMLIQAKWKPDLVLGIAPAFFSALNVIGFAGFTKSKCWLHIQDFELDAAFDLGILPGRKYLYPVIKKFETKILRRFDRISTISNRMALRLQEKGLTQERITLLPNWVDPEKIYPLAKRSPMRAQYGIPDDKVVVLYSGNMGQKQGLEILINTAEILSRELNLCFVLCGDGAVRRDLVETSKNLCNVRFLPLQPVEELNNLLNLADIHVLPQRAGAADLVMPSKLSGMLASGRPVIVTANEHTELSQVMNGIGYVVKPGDERSLAENIKILARDEGLRHYTGALGREYVEAHWSKDIVLGRFQRQLESLVEDRSD